MIIKSYLCLYCGKKLTKDSQGSWCSGECYNTHLYKRLKWIDEKRCLLCGNYERLKYYKVCFDCKSYINTITKRTQNSIKLFVRVK